MRIRFKVKLLLFVLSVVLLPTFGLVIFFIGSFNALTDFSLQQNAEGIRQSNHEFLTNLASDKARLISLQFKRAVDSVTILGKAAQKLVDNYGELAGLEDIYRVSPFRDKLLDYRKALTNSPKDDVNVLIPPSLTSHPRAKTYLKVSSLLDLLIGPVFESNENNSFVYFVGDREDPITRAYPNINLAEVLGDSLDTLFWKGFFQDNVKYWERFYTDEGFRARVSEGVGSMVTFDPPYEDAAGQGKIMTLFYPLWDKQKNLFAGVAAADVSLAKILENVLAMRVAKTGYCVLINGKGEIIALPDQAEKGLKVGVDSIQRNGLKYYYRSLAHSEDTGMKAIYGKIMAEKSGYLTVGMDDGEQHVLVFASLDPINDTGYGQDTWKVLINVPERETLDTLFRTNEIITARLTRTTLFSLIVVAGIVALIVLLTFFLADRITRNIGQLSLAAAKISQKNYDIELAIPSGDEIGDLGGAFMQMSREIGNYTEHLQDLVATRTGELEGAFKEISHLNEKLKDENLELSRTFIQASLDGFWTNDFSGQILDVNERLCRMLGYSREELLCMRVQDIEDPDAPEKIGSHMQLIVEAGGAQFQTHHRRKEGTLIDVEISAQYVAVLGQRFFVFARDITERKRAEEAQRYHASLVQTVSDAIISTDMAFKVRSWNEAAERLYGWRAGEVIGKPLSEIVKAEYPNETREAVTEAILRDGHWKGELIQHGRNGSPISILGSVELIRDEKGKPTGTVAVNHDITERKRAEREHDRLEAQLRQAQKMETVGQLAGGVAHDFNNMLQVIMSCVEMSLNKVDAGQPLHKYLLEIERVAQRSAEITGQLLAFARKQTVSPKVLDLNEAVSNTRKMMQRLIGEDIDLVWMPGRDLWRVKIDPAQLDQILANLAVNARDAIGGVGKLTIETENVNFDEAYCATHAGSLPGEFLLLTVSDDGRGMDKETQAHLFEPFFTTKGPGKGTGLGLATVYGIVKQNNGFINVYSEPGAGATFRVYLPRAEGAAEAGTTQGAAAAPQGGPETVLVVEDETAILELAKESLEQLGYTVLTASSPEEAMRRSKGHAGPIQLLITDVVMPQMNGRQLAQRLSAARPGLKLLYMSGYTANVIAHRGVLEQGVSFIAKPFSFAVLAAKVREVLDSE